MAATRPGQTTAHGQESKQLVVYESATGRVVVVDSLAYLTPDNQGDIIVCGSHGGEAAARHALRFQPRSVFFNDAGRGKEDAGVAGVKYLDTASIPAAAVDTMSARIGDGLDSFECGILSVVNATAAEAGLRVQMSVKEAVKQILA